VGGKRERRGEEGEGRVRPPNENPAYATAYLRGHLTFLLLLFKEPKISQLILSKIVKNCCHQMSDAPNLITAPPDP